jgi:hypothetical protein
MRAGAVTGESPSRDQAAPMSMSFRVLALASVLMGCSDEPIARVLVYFDAEAGATMDATTFRVTVLRVDPNPAQIEQIGYQVVEADPAVGQVAFPFGLTLEPLSDASTVYEVVGELFDATSATAFSTQRARGQYVEGEALELRLVFDADCADAICTENETCQNGACFEPCVVPTAIGLLGDRRSPAISCPESAECPDGQPLSCVPHGTGQGVHSCVDGVHVIRHCDTTCSGAPAACD